MQTSAKKHAFIAKNRPLSIPCSMGGAVFKKESPLRIVIGYHFTAD